MKNLLKLIIIFSIFSTPVQAACDFLIDIGDSGKKVFDKFDKPLPGYKGQYYLPVPSPELCPNDNLNDDIAVEYVFLGETEDAAKLAAIRMIVMNDGKNTENNKLTLMRYVKKVYGDFDTGQNPQIFDSFKIWEKSNNDVIVYKRMLGEEELFEEELMITTVEYDEKLGKFYYDLEVELEKMEQQQ